MEETLPPAPKLEQPPKVVPEVAQTTHWPKNKIGRTRVRKFNERPICYYCDREHKKIAKFSVDHIEPQSKGGKKGENGDNLVLCCKSCNGDKRDYMPDQYMELCIRRAKRVVYANRPTLWRKVCLFGKLLKLWFSIGEGIR